MEARRDCDCTGKSNFVSGADIRFFQYIDHFFATNPSGEVMISTILVYLVASIFQEEKISGESTTRPAAILYIAFIFYASMLLKCDVLLTNGIS